MGIIYKVTNKKNGKIYIGKTIGSLAIRKNQHFKGFLKKQTHFYRALRKYGWKNFEWKVIHRVNCIKDLNKWEVFYIKKHKSNERVRGYNLTLGGDGGDVLTHNPNRGAIIKKLRGRFGKLNSFWGRKHTKKVKKIIAKFSKIIHTGRKNTQETKDKQRVSKLGELNHQAILNEAKILKIRDLLQKGNSQYKIAKKFNVSRATVERVKLGSLWGHIKSSHKYPEKRGKKLTVDKVKIIKRMIKQGTNAKVVSSKFKISIDTYYDILNEKNWKDVK